MKFQTAQVALQKFGATLSAMVMPNIGVFIGWGLLTALFIPTGWMPNAYWSVLVGPVLTYLLPALIGYTAGYNVYGRRGGVIGAFATMGVVIGADVVMLVGGMVMGPLAAYALKRFDQMVQGRVKTGMEMLVDNFSLGLIGVGLCMVGYAAVAPIMTGIQSILSFGVNYMTVHGFLPLAALFVQPAQILFLNNAINHGIMVPLGLQQAAEVGKSVLFLVEANGANWVGLVAAFAVFGAGMAKKTAPGAVAIMFFGGIAEVCFPYCLMQPLTILGPIAGNMFALSVLTLFDGGAVGPPSPGSVFAFYLMTPKDSMLVNTVAYFGSLTISFLVTGLVLKLSKQAAGESDADVGESAAVTAPASAPAAGRLAKLGKIAFACDSGMGSSAMGVSILRTRLAKAQLHPSISHMAVEEIPQDADIVVTNISLLGRAQKTARPGTPILTISNFMEQKEYDAIAAQIQGMLAADQAAKPQEILKRENIVLGASFRHKGEAINACADLLIGSGYAAESYRADMFTRDADVSVYLGNGVALPHGLASSKEMIYASGICFIQVPEGVSWGDGNTAYLVIGVAGRETEHTEILGRIAEKLCVPEYREQLRRATHADDVMAILQLHP